MQAAVLEENHPCRTPNFDRLAQEGITIAKAYTPNAVCSPARASLMTGLLPHNHGVLQVIHTTDADQNCLRKDKPHWAQYLQQNGYRTGYFGKWHAERSNQLEDFGWEVNGERSQEMYQRKKKQLQPSPMGKSFKLAKYLDQPHGYSPSLLYGVTEIEPECRDVGITTSLALDFLEERVGKSEPWCCFVSVIEPHDPFVCGEQAFSLYDPDQLELPPNATDTLENRPALYRKSARAYENLTLREKKEAMACYYGSVTEIDAQFGKLIDFLRDRGELENTIIVLTSDHGELLGAHGLYCKNTGAFEEVYRIPMILSGPGMPKGLKLDARAGLHDLGPTLLELTGCGAFNYSDSRSFAPLLQLNYEAHLEHDQEGYAEYHGGRYLLTQRIVWDGDWKLVFNGFDFDELYNLKQDPHEMENLIHLPDYQEIAKRMFAKAWRKMQETGDHSLLNSHYPPLRLAPYGPLVPEHER